MGEGEPCIAVRTDIDALPINEQVDHDFTSSNEGAMHACGHDIHMASILAVATKLKAQESDLKGRVKFLFQPAEEVGTGALAMAETNALDDVKAIVGFHNYPTLDIGNLRLSQVLLRQRWTVLNLRFVGKVRMPRNLNKVMILLWY